MATFESALRDRRNVPVATSQKYPYKRLDPSVQKFTKVLEIDLNRLRHHKANIEKYYAAKQWDLLTKEQINSSRTVKKIKSTIKQLEQTRAQVIPQDVERFDYNVEDIREKAGSAVIQFLEVHNIKEAQSLDPLVEVERTTNLESSEGNEINSGSPLKTDFDADGIDTTTEGGSTLPSNRGPMLSGATENEPSQIQLHGSESNDAGAKQAEQSWQDLKNNLVELNGLIHVYHSSVVQQQETINTIEDNVESSQQNVEQGVLNLATAAKLKTAAFPVAGAVLGTMVAGPVGLVAGLKLGGLAAVGGGIAGFGGGQILKKHQEKASETQVQSLSSRQEPSVVTETSTSSPSATASASREAAVKDEGTVHKGNTDASMAERGTESWLGNKLSNLFN